MPRKRQRTTSRGSWSPSKMASTVRSVLDGLSGCPTAAKTYGVPQTTLERRIKATRSCVSNSGDQVTFDIVLPLGPKATVFTEEEENELEKYLVTMESRFFGLTRNEFMHLAFQLAEKNNKKHTFCMEKESAGEDWLKGFFGRHPKLSIRKPEPTSKARAMGFNKPVVDKYFELLKGIIDKYKLTPDRVWNCDETGVSVVPKSVSSVISLKGRRQVGCLTSAERGQTITVEICMNAVGSYLPPAFIFPRVKLNANLKNGAFPGSIFYTHPSGWMQSDIFTTWLKEFITFSKASKQSPVLLLLDGHSTHTKNIHLIDLARDHGVILLCLPPHCTHKLQPLDVAFMKPLSTYYDEAVRRWLRSHPGRVVSQFQVAELFSEAFIQAASMKTAVNGFKKTGIWPFDPSVFCETDFVASLTTDQPTDIPIVEGSGTPLAEAQLAVHVTAQENPQPGQVTPIVQNPVIQPPSASAFKSYSPENLIPIPHVGTAKTQKTRKNRGKTAVLTSTPYKQELAKKEKAEEEKKKLKAERAQKKLKRQQTNAAKRKLSFEEAGGAKKKTLKRVKEAEDKEYECIYCKELYSDSVEAWVKCLMCHEWAHCSCAGENPKDKNPKHLCEFCKQ